MTQQWSTPGWALAVVLALGVLLLAALVATGLALRGVRRSAARAEAEARTATALLRERLEVLERRVDAPARARAAEGEFVITHLGADDEVDETTARTDGTSPAARPDAPLFADLVLRESVVQAASLAAGVRRALGPEVRHRVRLEMRREVKRARKQRRTDQREARRVAQARQRAGLDLSREPAA
ncbi:hypothetical protein [Nocardioides sp. Leaf307]|uniref:hypothetical protein n=1 Tax=Nocardioides sp. Leaf307 TaxID=1736331 RepID=UPI0007030C80|nr:hypothetical protein [Nocardioides sp. Leaf307]KQQ41314.1 hypothetical protein ASF50_09685 [Nocardioides sp. Leaf307]